MGDDMSDHRVGLSFGDMGGQLLQGLGHGVVSCLGPERRRSARDGACAADLPLQLKDAVKQRLGVGGQPGT